MKKILYSILISAFLLACSDQKVIPEEKLQAIITEALLSESIMNREQYTIASNAGIALDSIDIYKPILDKHGYTIKDFKHTVDVLSTRKSNPLINVLTNVAKEIDQMEAIARYRYQHLMKFDTMALNLYADTIYTKDTTIIGSLKKYKINHTPTPVGTYTITFDYTSVNDRAISTKTMIINVATKTGNKDSKTFTMRKNSTPQKFKQEFKLVTAHDSLRVEFKDFEIPKDSEIKDTSVISNIMIIHYPPTDKARMNYYYKLTGFVPSLKEYYEKQFANKADSITIPFERGWEAEEKRRDSLQLHRADSTSRNRR